MAELIPEAKREVTLYLHLAGGFYKRLFRFTETNLKKLEFDFIDYHRNKVVDAFGYDCEAWNETDTEPVPVRLVVNMAQVAFIA